MLANDSAYVVILLLGTVHGINPAMGWLFAVSIGLQERSGQAVWRALAPLALGHTLAIAATLSAAVALGVVIPLAWIRWIAAGALLGFGCFHLVRHRHPRARGMCVGAKDLTLWSFFVAAAHGAGLMILPFVLRLAPSDGHGAEHGGAPAPAFSGHLAHAGLFGGETAAVLATLLHTAGYLLAAGAVASVVYHKLGLRLLRTAWINLNMIWAMVLLVTAVLTPLL